MTPTIGAECKEDAKKGTESEEDAASLHDASDESGSSPAAQPARKRRRMEDVSVNKVNSRKRGQTKPNRAKKKTILDKAKRLSARETNVGGKTTFSVESIMTSFKDTTEYGQSFRKMTSEEQTSEVLRLNKGAASGMKGAIKKQRIQSQFKELVTDKMKEYLIQNRTQQTYTANMILRLKRYSRYYICAAHITSNHDILC